MSYVKAFILFWYDFIVGDDWVIAAGVVAALFGTHVLTTQEVEAWWLVPLTVVVLLYVSLMRAVRKTHS